MLPALLTQFTPPVDEPVTVAQFRDFARIDLVDPAAGLEAFLLAARQHVETFTGRQLLTAEWRLQTRFPCFREPLRLPRPLHQSVESVEYIPPGGGAPIAFTDFALVADEHVGYITPDSGILWPMADEDAPFPVMVEFTSGWEEPDDVPKILKLAIQMLATHWHEYRQPHVEIQGHDVPFTVDAILQPWRIISY